MTVEYDEYDRRVNAVKMRRNNLLAICDWTQMNDTPEATKNMWAAYRKSLRDITDHPNYPYLTEEEWPVAPQK